MISYILAVVAGILLGIIAESWARKTLPAPPVVHHNRCEERYEALLYKYRVLQSEYMRDLNVREEEIQRLVRGAS